MERVTPKEDADFIAQHERLVHSIARRLLGQLELTCDLDDLVAFGFEGLMDARARFDPARGVQFSTFAYYRVRGSVLDGVRKMAYLPRRAHAKFRAAEAADRVAEEASELTAALPPEARTAERAAVAIDATLGRMTAAFVLASLGQDPDEPSVSPEDEVAHSEAAFRVRDALAALPERERNLIAGFYLEDRRFDDVAKELGISKSWASRLHTKALERLRASLLEFA